MECARFLINIGNWKIVMDNKVISCNFDEYQDQIHENPQNQGSLIDRVDIPRHMLKVAKITSDGTPKQKFFMKDYFTN